MVVGNLFIVAASFVLGRLAPPATPAAAVPGVDHLAMVDSRVWRGSAPSSVAGYEALAAAGVTTVVDLRAEPGSAEEDAPITALGLQMVHLPIRDGQTPSQTQLDAFRRIVDTSEGTVFVHCAAGVGRTGSMVAAYLVSTGQASGLRSTVRNLAIGPPSLEQIAFGLGLSGDEVDSPALPVVAVSRVLDAPRRLWSSFG
jgi:protein tyrosine phosphatase (PTP) superfamily phosphohydrolase (DUF442 family)